MDRAQGFQPPFCPHGREDLVGPAHRSRESSLAGLHRERAWHLRQQPDVAVRASHERHLARDSARRGCALHIPGPDAHGGQSSSPPSGTSRTYYEVNDRHRRSGTPRGAEHVRDGRHRASRGEVEAPHALDGEAGVPRSRPACRGRGDSRPPGAARCRCASAHASTARSGWRSAWTCSRKRSSPPGRRTRRSSPRATCWSGTLHSTRQATAASKLSSSNGSARGDPVDHLAVHARAPRGLHGQLAQIRLGLDRDDLGHLRADRSRSCARCPRRSRRPRPLSPASVSRRWPICSAPSRSLTRA